MRLTLSRKPAIHAKPGAGQRPAVQGRGDRHEQLLVGQAGSPARRGGLALGQHCGRGVTDAEVHHVDIVAYSSIRVERQGSNPVDDFAQGRTVYTCRPRVVPDLAQLETPSKTLLHGLHATRCWPEELGGNSRRTRRRLRPACRSILTAAAALFASSRGRGGY